MTQYRVFQQLAPVQTSREPEEWESRLREVGMVTADCGNSAIDRARELTAIRTGRGLGRYPIVAPIQ
jgi:hypothetical protein